MAYLGNAPVVGDSTNSFKLLDDIASFTLTFDATDTSVVSISGDTLSFTNHRFVTGQKVTYTDGGGTAIGGLTDGTSYFIIKVDQNTIKLATNASNAASSTAINLTSGAAGGSHTLKVAFDGVNTKFKATHGNGTKASVSRAGQISLSINGVIQQPQDSSSPSVGYGVEADSTIVFSTAPVATDKVFATFIGEVAPSFDITDNTIDNFTGDGSTTIFNLSKEVPSSQDVLVTLDGVTQHPSDGSTTRSYSVINQALTFVSAPATGVAIQARHIGFAGATTSAVTGFYGRTGNAALISTDDISVQNISAGIATFNTIAVGGTVSIGGTLTYEDVTNIDSVGLVTARNGIVVGSGITLSKDGDGFFTGIVTATSYYGDGSNLSNITSTTINNNADNRLITGSGTANTLEAESTLTYDGTNLDLGDSKKIRLGASQDLQLYHDGSNSYVANSTGTLLLQGSSTTTVKGTTVQFENAAGTEVLLKAIQNGQVELYYDNSKKMETVTGGVYVYGDLLFGVGTTGHLYGGDNDKLILGSGSDFHLYHDGSTNIIDATTSNAISFRRGGSEQFFIGNAEFKGGDSKKIKLGTDDDFHLFHDGTYNYIDCVNDRQLRIVNDTQGANEVMITATPNGAVELYYNNSEKFNTGDNGITVKNGGLNIQRQGVAHAGAIYWAGFGDTNHMLWHDYFDNPNGTRGTGNGFDGIKWNVYAGINFYKGNEAETIARFLGDGSCELYYNNEMRVQTVSGGVIMGGGINEGVSEPFFVETGGTIRRRYSTSAGSGFHLTGGGIFPTTGPGAYSNGGITWGTSSYRWGQIFSQYTNISTSDRNLKNTITTSDLGLDFVNQLKPVSYKFNRETSDRTHYGLISQDVEDLLPKIGKTAMDFGGFCKDKNSRIETNDDGTDSVIEEEGETYSLRYDEFIAPLIKAVQELSAKNDALEARIKTLEG